MHLHDPSDERELDARRADLEALANDLVEAELVLFTLREELTVFRAEYARTVGAKYARLDDVGARLAEARAARRVDDPSAQEAARHARERADATEAEVRGWEPLARRPRFEPKPAVKRLYIEIARELHPDLAPGDEEATVRRPWMAGLNDALRNQSVDALKALRLEWGARSEPVPGVPGGEVVDDDLTRAWLFGELTTDDYAHRTHRTRILGELASTTRRVADAKRRLAVIRAEIDELKAGALHGLYQRHTEAREDDRSLLDEMSARLDEEMAYVRWEGGPRRNVGPSAAVDGCGDLPARGLSDLERWRRSRRRASDRRDGETVTRAAAVRPAGKRSASSGFEFRDEQWSKLRPVLDRVFRGAQRELRPGQDLLREFVRRVKSALIEKAGLPKHIVKAAVIRWNRETRGGRDVAPAETGTDRSGSGAAAGTAAGGANADREVGEGGAGEGEGSAAGGEAAAGDTERAVAAGTDGAGATGAEPRDDSDGSRSAHETRIVAASDGPVVTVARADRGGVAVAC